MAAFKFSSSNLTSAIHPFVNACKLIMLGSSVKLSFIFIIVQSIGEYTSEQDLTDSTVA